jgi:hypothetical protein
MAPRPTETPAPARSAVRDADASLGTAGWLLWGATAVLTGVVAGFMLYPGAGHLLSRALAFRAQESGPFDPDPAAVADGGARTGRFLTALGYTR